MVDALSARGKPGVYWDRDLAHNPGQISTTDGNSNIQQAIAAGFRGRPGGALLPAPDRLVADSGFRRTRPAGRSRTPGSCQSVDAPRTGTAHRIQSPHPSGAGIDVRDVTYKYSVRCVDGVSADRHVHGVPQLHRPRAAGRHATCRIPCVRRAGTLGTRLRSSARSHLESPVPHCGERGLRRMTRRHGTDGCNRHDHQHHIHGELHQLPPGARGRYRLRALSRLACGMSIRCSRQFRHLENNE